MKKISFDSWTYPLPENSEMNSGPASRKVVLEPSGLLRLCGMDRVTVMMMQMIDIWSIQDLKGLDPQDVHGALLQLNVRENLVRKVPSKQTLEAWVRQAQDLG